MCFLLLLFDVIKLYKEGIISEFIVIVNVFYKKVINVN